jgi:Transposase, Mutator family
MVWVRAATRSWRRLVNRCKTTAWSSTPTCCSRGTLWAATATETASCGSLLRPCLMSKDQVSRLCRGLDTQVRVFRERPLEGRYP